MGKFFTPLRRKIGFATLAVTCVFAMGWVRSQEYVDGIVINGWKSFISIRSLDQVLLVVCTGPPSRDAEIISTSSSRNSDVEGYRVDSEGQRIPRTFSKIGSPASYASLGGLGLGSGQSRWSDQRVRWIVIPYVFVVPVLTIISAYLFMSRPSAKKIDWNPIFTRVRSRRGISGMAVASMVCVLVIAWTLSQIVYDYFGFNGWPRRIGVESAIGTFRIFLTPPIKNAPLLDYSSDQVEHLSTVTQSADGTWKFVPAPSPTEWQYDWLGFHLSASNSLCENAKFRVTVIAFTYWSIALLLTAISI